VQVGEARDDLALAAANGTLLGVGDDALVVVDRHAYADARGLVDLVRLARFHRDLREQLLDEAGDAHLAPAALPRRHLLLHDRDLVLDATG
jgi:hypothetical protein